MQGMIIENLSIKNAPKKISRTGLNDSNDLSEMNLMLDEIQECRFRYSILVLASFIAVFYSFIITFRIIINKLFRF